MKIAVMGAGAVGCYYGGMLARAGHEVTLIGRAAHVEAVRSGGLVLETQTFTQRVPIDASTEVSAAKGADLVLVCVKSTDTEAAATELAPHLGAMTVLLSLQNGVDNAKRLQTALGRPVIAAVVYVAAEMAGPGHVRHHGRGDLVIGQAPTSFALAASFEAADIPMQVSNNVIGELWAKLVINCSYNALSAIAQMTYGALVLHDGVDALIQDVVNECLAVAHAASVSVPGDTHAAVKQIAQSMATQVSSTAHDLARGKPSEIDHLNGFVMRQGQAFGVATPVNRALWVLVKLREPAKQLATA